ncbi:putative amino acid permease [Microstroma glucosiphilum]|uniref:Putative amino acid permease n=1 Tax=Pseudomicrostroma glucosiphilum TaxID=1684307 RepID=A0A316U1K8_9BASI|nr:putative amino acid permease [Pseudomicrostroma glucosiphilum]PWN18371.1 putative amino acid permease [Pseudomicrostroma glucosiphilum]
MTCPRGAEHPSPFFFFFFLLTSLLASPDIFSRRISIKMSTAASAPAHDHDERLERDKARLKVYSEGHSEGLDRKLRSFHITMIGFSSGIGTGLFIGTGSAYASAGPAGLCLAYCIVGTVLWCVMQSIGELATLVPTAGSFPHWATRFIDPSVGFSLAISYGYCYSIAIASEVSAAAVLVSYWTDVSPVLVITLGLAAILALNLTSVEFFGHSEVIAGSIKVLCFIGLTIVAVVITSGGGPNGSSSGFQYWNNPGPWTQYNDIAGSTGRFVGVLSALVNASFSFIGIETVVITAAESINPHRDIPRAAKRVTYRIAFFYILSVLLIGLIVDPRNPSLVSGTGNANSSPWVIAIQAAGIKVLPSVVNACILISAWSAGNSYCWVGSRIILSMAADRQLPAVFARTWRNGVPWVAVLGQGGPSQAFSWLLNLSTVAGLITWTVLCLCYIRFNAALRRQGRLCNPMPLGSGGATILTFISGFSIFLKGDWVTSNFIASYVGIPVFIISTLGWKTIKRSKFVHTRDADLWSGRLEMHEAQQIQKAASEPISASGRVSRWLL